MASPCVIRSLHRTSHAGGNSGCAAKGRGWSSLPNRDDSGAALIIALIFLIVGALAVAGLVTFAGTALMDTAQLKSTRALQYAADGATDIAIQAVRYSPDAYEKPTLSPATPPQNCLGPNSVLINGFHISVDCTGTKGQLEQFAEGVFTAGSRTVSSSGRTIFFGDATFVGWRMVSTAVPLTPPTTITTENNTAHTVTLSASATTSSTVSTPIPFQLVPPQERIINFYACIATRGTCTASNSQVHAVVNFNDVSPPAYECSKMATTTCGTSMVIEQWVSELASH